MFGRIESFEREIRPALLREDPSVRLVIPIDIWELALGIVIGAGQTDKRGTASDPRHHFLDEPSTRPHLDQLA